MTQAPNGPALVAGARAVPKRVEIKWFDGWKPYQQGVLFLATAAQLLLRPPRS